MSRIKNMTHLGLFLSMLPTSEIKEMIFDHGIMPTYIGGVTRRTIHETVTFRFLMSKGSDTVEFSSSWKPSTQEVTYKYGSSRPRGSRKFRRLDGLSWKIDFLNNLQTGWQISSTRIVTTNKYVRDHLDDFVASFDP